MEQICRMSRLDERKIAGGFRLKNSYMLFLCLKKENANKCGIYILEVGGWSLKLETGRRKPEVTGHFQGTGMRAESRNARGPRAWTVDNREGQA